MNAPPLIGYMDFMMNVSIIIRDELYLSCYSFCSWHFVGFLQLLLFLLIYSYKIIF